MIAAGYIIDDTATLMPCYPAIGETKRMRVRASMESDYLQWIPFFEDKESVRYFPNPEGLNSVELSRKWVSSHIENYKAGVYGQMALISKGDGNLIGSAGFLMCEIDDNIEVQTGVAILPQYQKRRYALEALEYLNIISENYKICSLISIVHKDNIASQGLTEKSGKMFVKEMIYENCLAFLYRKNFLR